MAPEPVTVARAAPDVLAALRLLRRSLSRAASASFAKSGVGPKQVLVLRELRELGSSTQVELARATLTDPAALMRAIDALERRGWVSRSSAEDDRRCKVVSLTAEGRRALRALDAGYERLRSAANGALSAAERRQFCALATKLAALMGGAGAAAPDGDES